MTSALVVGGTGIISTAIVLSVASPRRASVGVQSWTASPSPAREGVRMIRGDRANASDFVLAFEGERFDVVYETICYTAEDAEASVHAFSGRCEAVRVLLISRRLWRKMPTSVLIDEALSTRNRPVTGGRAKS